LEEGMNQEKLKVFVAIIGASLVFVSAFGHFSPKTRIVAGGIGLSLFLLACLLPGKK
jgi:hypothetical protein